MKPAFARSYLAGLAALTACGYHDTPVATYQVLTAGVAGLAGTGGAGGTAGGGGGAGLAGSLVDAGSAGAPAEGPLCLQTYPTLVDGLTSRYKQGAIRQNWVDAERDCEADGGHLIVIDDEAENTWLAQIAALSLTNQKSSHQLAWLGLGDHAVEGEFSWVTGAPLALSFWFSGEPNSLNKAEDCGEMRASGAWNDDRCNAELTYVCECDALPSAGEWCDTDDNATCGNCSTACASDQTCTSQLCK